jgi:hypothetical protein
MRIMRTWSGVDRMRTEVRIELMQLDLPAPVAPAMRMWGIVARFISTALPVDVAAHGDLERMGGALGLGRR